MNGSEMIRDRMVGDMYRYYQELQGVEPSVYIISVWKNQHIELLKAKHSNMKEQYEKKILL